jgi:hypothetical protein
MGDDIMPNDRDVSTGPESPRTQSNVLLTPCQRVGYAVTLVGFLLFTLFTAIVFGPAI